MSIYDENMLILTGPKFSRVYGPNYENISVRQVWHLEKGPKMRTYNYNVDTIIRCGNSTVTTSFGFDTVAQALKCFNDSIETRRCSHVDGQVWSVTLYDMGLCDIMGHISSIDFNLE